MLGVQCIVVCLISAIAAYLGTLMINRRMSLVAGPLGHLALPGVALAFLFHWDLFLCAAACVLFGGVLVWFFRRVSHLPFETLTGIAFAFGLALGLLFLPMEHAEEAISGKVELIGLEDLVIAIVISVVVFALLELIKRDIVLLSLSEDLARTMGVSPEVCDLAYLFVIALTTAAEVKIVGGVLTVALVILPAASAVHLAKSLKAYQVLAVLLAVLGALIGMGLHVLSGLSAGPLIVLVDVFFFFLSLVVQRLLA